MESSDLDLIVTGKKDKICMIEGGSNFVPEKIILEALDVAMDGINDIVDLQMEFSEHFDKPRSTLNISSALLKNAYDLSRWINHHQGFEMLTLAAKEYKWSLNLSQVASVWAEGCIIKSDLMDDCIKLLQDNTMLLLSEDFKQLFTNGKENWKELLQQAVANEIPTPCMQSAWTYFAALKTQNSSANIIQAQRDYFGAHGFLRTDNESQGLKHGPWSS